MKSRCPNCGALDSDEARQCRTCGWNFTGHQKSEKKPEPGETPFAPPPPPPKQELPQEEAARDDVPAALCLPASTKEIVVEPAAKPQAGRPSAVYLAALAGGALGLLGVGAIFMMIRSEPQVAARSTGSPPFGKRAAGDVMMTPVLDAPDPVPADSSPSNPPRATATFAQSARPAPVAPAAAAMPDPPVPVAAPEKPAAPQWMFEGAVYDLLSARGVYGARLVFVDADDNEVAAVETGEDGRYRAAMKAGPDEGYALRILHDDYTGKRIDELDSTSSMRKADLAQRKFLMQADARSLPWIGAVGKPVRRDMALVPKVAAE